jgi:beta-N-acetylhexosaminidase
MSVAELAGQMIMIGLEQTADGSPVLALGDRERALVGEVRPGGVILFGANFQTVAQVHALVRDLQRVTPVPLIIATDHEGGLVSRLTASGGISATVMPSETLLGIAAETLVERGEADRALDLARRWGKVIGAELRSLGVTMNMAPVADVGSPDRPGMLSSQRRTFGTDPATVAMLTAASVEGMHSEGVCAVLKHFPGQGGAVEDPHTMIVSLDHTLDTLRRVDLVPFRAGISAGARAVMSAHISYPNATGNDLPATVSRQLISGLLRDELGFDGVVITDALNMDAVARRLMGRDLAVEAILAGADIVLKPLEPEAAHAALVDAVVSGKLSRGRLEESVERILQLKLTSGLFGPVPSWVDPNAGARIGAATHQALADEIRAVASSRR